MSDPTQPQVPPPGPPPGSFPTAPTPPPAAPPPTVQQPAVATAPPAYAAAPAGYAAPPPGYGAPPPAYPAPAVQGWGQAPPPQPNKRKPGVIIGAAVAAIGLVGGTFAVINLTKDKEKPAVPTTPSGVGVTIDPNDGPAPAPPDTPATIPGPTTPPSVVTTTLPPPTTGPPPTSPPPTSPPSGDVQSVFDRVAVAVPGGWDVQSADEGFVSLQTDGAMYFVTAGQFNGDAHTLVSGYFQQSVQGQLQDVQVQGEGDADVPTSSVVSGYVLSYQGVLATQQGSVPVEGIIIAYVTQDGIGVATETFNAVGAFDTFVNDYDAMLNSVISTL